MIRRWSCYILISCRVLSHLLHTLRAPISGAMRMLLQRIPIQARLNLSSRYLPRKSHPLRARFCRREDLRIMLRDVLKIARLAEITAEISSLTDVLIATALLEAGSCVHKRFGLPQHPDAQGRLASTPFAVLALGKLGGNELN